MEWRDICLVLAALIGSGVALAHGTVTQKRIVAPLQKILQTDDSISNPIKRVIPPLLHYSTVTWFLGGIVLIIAIWLQENFRLAAGLLVGSLYLYGALIALWASRGRHPAWILYALALVLIGLGVG